MKKYSFQFVVSLQNSSCVAFLYLMLTYQVDAHIFFISDMKTFYRVSMMRIWSWKSLSNLYTNIDNLCASKLNHRSLAVIHLHDKHRISLNQDSIHHVFQRCSYVYIGTWYYLKIKRNLRIVILHFQTTFKKSQYL